MTTIDGWGLAGVAIRYGLFCRPNSNGSIVGFTAENGYHDIQGYCPYGHDETTPYTPVLDGYNFQPEMGCLRTYGYYPGSRADFTATPLNLGK